MKKVFFLLMMVAGIRAQALTPTPTDSPTATPSNSPSPTYTYTITLTSSPTPSNTPTVTPTPTYTWTPTSTWTPTYTDTPTYTVSPTFSASPTPNLPKVPSGVSVGTYRQDNSVLVFWNTDLTETYFNIYTNGKLMASPNQSQISRVSYGPYAGQSEYLLRNLSADNFPIDLTMTAVREGSPETASSSPVTITAKAPGGGFNFGARVPGSTDGDGGLAAFNFQMSITTTATYINLTAETGLWAESNVLMSISSGTPLNWTEAPAGVTFAPSSYAGYVTVTWTPTVIGPVAPNVWIWLKSSGSDTINFLITQ